MSNYFPKYSPDGKWIIFTKSKSYMLLQPDSELWIVPAAGGEARRLRYNTPRMNSWHSWSSNSRWLVFSSKVNTAYTQLFLTHIDDDGNDTPPVLLERFTSSDRAANIPEFVRLPGDAIAEIKEQFLDPYSFLRAGMSNERTGDHKGAERAFRRGIGESVHVLGHREDIPEILAASDLVVDASYAGLGLTGSLREALAVETPVIATDIEGHPELIVEGETGLLVPPRNPDAMAQAILRLLENPTRAKAMARAGRKRVEAHFSMAQKVQRTEALYQRLLAARTTR